MISPVNFETFQSILSLVTQHYNISKDAKVTLRLFDEYKGVPDKKICTGFLRSGAQCSMNISKEISFCKRHDPVGPHCQGCKKDGKPCSCKVKNGNTHCFQHQSSCAPAVPAAAPGPVSAAAPPAVFSTKKVTIETVHDDGDDSSDKDEKIAFFERIYR